MKSVIFTKMHGAQTNDAHCSGGLQKMSLAMDKSAEDAEPARAPGPYPLHVALQPVCVAQEPAE